MLQTGNNEFKAQGTFLSLMPKVRSDILERLAEEHTAYPRDEQLEEVAKVTSMFTGKSDMNWILWLHYLKIKMMNFRTKLRFVFY